MEKVEILKKTGLTPFPFLFNRQMIRLILIVGLLLLTRIPAFSEEDLWLAASKNDTKSIAELLKSGVNVNLHIKEGGSTPLHAAALSGAIDAINLLLKNGADINSRDGQKSTPLMEAALKNKKEAVRILLENGAKIEAADVSGETPLFYAVNNCDVHRNGGIYGTDSIFYLLEKGANPNSTNIVGHSILQMAVIRAPTKVVQALLNKGADPNYQWGPWTALSFAARDRRVEKIELLKPLTTKEQLWTAVALGDAKLVKQFLDKGESVHHADANKYNLLMLAAQARHFDVAKLLIEHEIDINAKDKEGLTALSYTSEDAIDIVKLLKEHGLPQSVDGNH